MWPFLLQDEQNFSNLQYLSMCPCLKQFWHVLVLKQLLFS